jgi:hypothetical protein
MKDQPMEILFHESFIKISSAIPSNVVIEIKNDICNQYDYNLLSSDYQNRNKLTIPSNFMLGHIYLSGKNGSNIEFYFGEDMNADRVNVFMHNANDNCEIFNNFSASLEV